MSLVMLLLWAGLVYWALGQIWFAQLVVYPLFARVGDEEYIRYHGFYLRHIPLPVIFPGFASFLFPIALALYGPPVPVWLNAANIAAGIVGLLVTVALEIPRHTRLERGGKNHVIIAELIRYNWPRTISITSQAAITALMLQHVFAHQRTINTTLSVFGLLQGVITSTCAQTYGFDMDGDGQDCGRLRPPGRPMAPQSPANPHPVSLIQPRACGTGLNPHNTPGER